MRTETGRALEQALAQGQSDARRRFGVKAAAMAHPMMPRAVPHVPLPRAAPGASAASATAAAAPGYGATPSIMAEAEALKKMNPAQRQHAFSNHENDAFMAEHGIAPHTAPAPGAGAPARRSLGQRIMSPVKKTLGYGMAGAAGVAGLGMYLDHKDDALRREQVYAPMGGYG